MLRRTRGASGGGVEGGEPAAPGVRGGMEDVPASQPNGDEVFLLHLGFAAPGPYELFIASATQVCVPWMARQKRGG